MNELIVLFHKFDLVVGRTDWGLDPRFVLGQVRRVKVQLSSHVRQNVVHRNNLTHPLASVATTLKLRCGGPLQESLELFLRDFA